MRTRLGFVLSAALLATVVTAAPAQATTTITELGGLPGGLYHGAMAINDAGVAVGRSRADTAYERGVKYDGTPTEVPGPAGLTTRLTSINSSGTMSGSTGEPFVHSSATRFHSDGTYQVLQAVEGYPFASGQAIDDSGTVYGSIGNGNGSQLPVRWDAAGVPTVLAMPAGMTSASLTGAANGYAAGSVWAAGKDSQAVRWNPDGSVTVLTGLAQRAPTYGRAVNRHGEVVGEAYTDGSVSVLGVRWGADGTIITTYGANTHPRGLNDHGVAVGFETTTVYDNLPMRWDATGTALNLGRPAGARRVEAVDINNNGVIVGLTGESLAPVTALQWTVS
ncbi:hypothetical protein [Lentzea sp. NBRC 102530]|uniref:hypothetical protein n=1 Tax=Lentzea sp. NBRC 102530 TaxID=3032201 RepID=UPI0024A20740|nr:hypothetical protein [Lentzea sp. NBRC 102530]GLY46922.1 hypothetical protein Lesp01_05780 [Lentzea sp. NBRC 102530]